MDMYGSETKIRQAWQEAFDNHVLHTSKRLIFTESSYIHDLAKLVEQERERGGVTMLVGDYVQSFKGDEKPGMNIKGMAVEQFKDYSRQWKIPVVLATQLAKSKFDRNRMSGIPISTDIEGLGEIFQSDAS